MRRNYTTLDNFSWQLRPMGAWVNTEAVTARLEADALIQSATSSVWWTGVKMAEDWKSYLCRVNDNLACIFVNVGLRPDVPIISKPWLLWVWVYFQAPRADGLSDNKEAPALFKIEDALTARLLERCGAIACGRITTEGRREFYFYAEKKDRVRNAVATALSAFGEYKFETGEQEDPLWEQYLNVLYPSPQQFERIKNREVLEVLAGHGDVPGASRDVQHWMYFKTEKSRASFKEAVVKAGYRIESESGLEDEELPFGISVIRNQPVEQALINATVCELVSLTEQFEGEYDGWETQVVTQ